ncbi:hypothetical protein [Streptomyces sp. NPDC088358]|uniref:hypothetical protein n=1 Tax=Streptomyces sp. NPDC088358 TaxID=3365857 RepID=UPI0037F9791D
METRTLGRQGLTVSAQGLGCMGMSVSCCATDETESLATIRALELGVTHQGAVAIPGTKRRRYLEENVAAADVTLTAGDIAAIEAAAPRDAVTGERYAPEYMGTLDG